MSIQGTKMMCLLKPNKDHILRQGILAAFLLIPFLGFGQVDPYLHGRASMSMERYDSAVIYLKQALQQSPGETEFLYFLGISYFHTHEFPAARDAFYEVEKRRTGMGSFYLAKTEVKLNHPEQALKYLRIHLSSRYREPESAILLDEDLSRLEGSSAWQQLWNEKNWYSSGDKQFQEALFLRAQGNHLEAINQLNDLEKQGYNRSEVQAEKASIYMQLGNEKAAGSELGSAVKSDIRNLDAAQRLAQILVDEGNPDEARAELDRVIRQDPARFDAYLQRAEARSLAGDLPGALQDMKLYLTYFPEDDEAIYRKGKIQFENGRYLDAIQSFNRALDLDRSKADYFFARGMTYAATGTTRYADKDLSMALDLDPLNGEVWYEKAILMEKLGDRAGACQCYSKAFQYGVFKAGEFLDNFCK